MFEPIGIVTANPNGYYTYSDNISKRSNEIIYYRIKQYDFNGNYTYSMVKSIANKLQSPLLIFPNPAYDVLAIKHPKIGQAALTVYNSNGQLCYSLQSVFDSDQTEIKINHLISGLYTIQLTTQSGMVYQNRFIKR